MELKTCRPLQNSAIHLRSLLAWAFVPFAFLFATSEIVFADNGVVCLARNLDNITIDGDLSDWPTDIESYPIQFTEFAELPRSKADAKAWFRVGTSENGKNILLAIEVEDDSIVVKKSFDWTAQDGCSIYLHYPKFSRQIFQYDYYGKELDSTDRDPEDQRLVSKKIKAKRATVGNKICYEWSFERPEFNSKESGPSSLRTQVALDISINDRDQDGTFSWISWGPGIAKVRNKHHLGDLLFVETDEKTCRLQGTLKFESGDVAKRALVKLHERTSNHLGEVVVGADANGRFDVWLPVGSYQVNDHSSNNGHVVDLNENEAERDLVVKTVSAHSEKASVPARIFRDLELRGDRKKFFQVNVSRHMGKVTAIAQSKAGGLWLGSERNLAYFDGRSLKFVAAENRDFRININSLVEDNEGSLWIGTMTGLYRYRDGLFTHFGSPLGMTQERVVDVQLTSEGKLIVATLLGVCRFDGKSFDLIYEQRKDRTKVTSILVRDDDEVWIGTRKGLHQVRGNQIAKTHSVVDGLPGEFITGLESKNENEFWIATEQGLARFDGQKFVAEEGLGKQKVFTIESGPQSELYVSAESGLHHYDGKRFRKTNMTATGTMFVDRESNLWTVFAGPSLARFETRHILRPIRARGKAAVRCGLYANDGSIWLGTKGGLHRWNQGAQNMKGMIVEAFAGQSVEFLLEDSRQDIWIASTNGITRFDGKKYVQIADKAKLNNRIAIALIEDHRGRIWAATNYNIYHIENDNVTKFEPFQGLVADRLWCLFEDSRNNIWVGTTFGLFRYDENGALMDDRIPVQNGPVNCIFENNDGQIWVGTEEGVFARTDDSWKHIENFGTNSVRDINYGNRGQVWIATEAGFIIYDGKTQQIISERDGLLSNSIVTTCRINQDEGLVVTDKGICRYRPKVVAPPVYIDSIRVGGVKVNSDNLKIHESAAACEFNFGSISFKTRPDAMLYRFRLVGLDSEWTISNDSTATYNGLPPGIYRFEVEAINRDLEYSNELAFVEFEVVKGPSEAWLSILTGFTIAAGFTAVCLIIRYYIGLKRFSGQLERRVEKRTQEVEELNKKLLHAQKLEAIGTISSGVAHDINNSLAAIVNFAQLAEEKINPDSEEAELVRLILDSTRQATGTTKGLLAFSGDATTDKKPVDIRKLLIRSIDFLQRLMPSTIHLRLDIPEPCHIISNVDEPAIQQVLMNLIINAKDAMPDGGEIRVALNTTPPEDGFVAIAVSDEGMGIDESLHLKIFDPFFSTKERGQGTGLGMSIAHGVIQDHGGKIEVHSSHEQGTTFRFTLPLSNLSLEVGSESGALEIRFDKLNVLVAEDNEKVNDALTKQLDSIGCNVVAKMDGEDLLAEFQKDPSAYDLALVDIDLPGMDGNLCLSEMRRRRKDFPVVLMSGYPVKDPNKLEATFLAKPFGKNELASAIFDAVPHQSIKSKGVLVIDDDELVRNSVAAYLDAHGLVAYQARTGIQALNELQQNSTDIQTILLDWGLGATDSEKLLSDIAEKYPQIRVFIFSGDAAKLSDRKNDERVAGCIQKPAIPSEILRLVS